MTSQERGQLLLYAHRDRKRLSETTRAREIDEATLLAANSNIDFGEALYQSQLAVFRAEMGAP